MKFVWLIFVTVFAANQVIGTYIITTPKKWPSEGLAQICVALFDGHVIDPLVDQWHVSIKEADKPKQILQKTQLSLPAGQTMACRKVRKPKLSGRKVTVRIEGTFAGTPFADDVNITVGGKVFKTFIQPDKAIYKPGQKVQFRLLTIKEKSATFINSSSSGVSTEPYPLVYIETPFPYKARIAQWRNVTNNGLVHLSMNLHEEAEEGIYKILVEHDIYQSFNVRFEVKQYTLPRYKVTVSSPKTIYGNSAEISLKLCAKYTFGQNVRGNASLSVSVGSYRREYANITKHALMDGCTTYTFPTDKLRFDDNNCHIRISSIKVDAKVEEEGTKNTIYMKRTLFDVNRQVVTFRDVSKIGIRKKYLPTPQTVQVTYPNSSVAAGEKVEACANQKGVDICRNFTTDAEGRLTILLNSDYSAGVRFTAVNYPSLEKNFNFVMQESSLYLYGSWNDKFTAAHNASVSIYYFGKLECKDGNNIHVNLPIIYVSDGQTTANIKVQTMSKGYVYDLYNETITLKNTPMPFDSQQFLLPLEKVPENIIRGMANISFTLPLTVSPKAMIMVWFKTTSNSIVADSKELEVTPCLGNKVDFSFSTNKSTPGGDITMTLSAEKNSLCGIGVVDKSVELLGKTNKLSAIQILQAASTNTPNRWDANQLDLEYCLKKYKNEKAEKKLAAAAVKQPSLYRTHVRRREQIEAIQVFNDAGYHVFSPFNLEKEVCDALLHKALKSIADRETFVTANKQHFSSVSFDSDRVLASPPMPEGGFSRPQSFAISNKEGVTVTEEVIQERVFFPETWLWELRTLGTGKLTETVTLPDTITEWIGSAICVGRETGVGISKEVSVTTFTPFFVELNLPATVKRGEHLPVIISIFSYSSSPLSVNLQLENSPDFDFVNIAGNTEDGARTFCLRKLEKFVRTIIIKPKVIGDMNITVEALSNRAISNCFDPNEPLKSDRIIKPVLVEAEGITRERVWTKYICPEDSANKDISWSISLPGNIVNDSERAWINVIGDMLGPSMKNLGSLVNMPHGCGEQNLITFLPNVFILEYLNASNEVVPELEEKLIYYINLGYQRQLKFARLDGSFSTFGEIDFEGSTWLTAYVLKAFSRASPYISVDQKIIRGAIDYLRKRKHTTGCFIELGQIINKAIVTQNIADTWTKQSLLTAYIVTTLVEAELLTTEKDLIMTSLPCILLDNSTHPYNLAVKAYSLALVSSPEAKNVIAQLQLLAVVDASEMRWILPDNDKNSALSVETASYALLAFLTIDSKAHRENSRKIVRWLSSQRNGRGGFVSTQDTVVALQALSLFERLQPSEAVNIAVTAKNTQISHTFQVKEENKLVEQRQNVDSVKENVNFNVQGTGCALIQGVLRYNVLSTHSSNAFNLSVITTVDSGCKYHNISICTNYLLADESSNMANIEVTLVTGYSPVVEDLQEVVLNNPFKRHEIEKGKIIFYLDEITGTNTCANFRVTQDLIVGNPQPGLVKVYDYYQPELSREENFTLEACKTSYSICIDPQTKRPVNSETSNNDLC